jgi:hypothetical protein
MLSETVCKKMDNDSLFLRVVSDINDIESNHISGREKSDVAVFNSSYYYLHKLAFETSLLINTKANLKNNLGDYLLSVASISDLGIYYLRNLQDYLHENETYQTSQLKRFDKLEDNISAQLVILEDINVRIKSMLSNYTNTKLKPETNNFSKLMKDITKVRRLYYSVKPKIDFIEDDVDYSTHSFKEYLPLMAFMRTHKRFKRTKISSDENKLFEVVVNFDSEVSKIRKKETLDQHSTKFIYENSLPPRVLREYSRFLTSMDTKITK